MYIVFALQTPVFASYFSLVEDYLVNLENHQTQGAHLDSKAFKIALFQTVNMFGPICYQAFIRECADVFPVILVVVLWLCRC